MYKLFKTKQPTNIEIIIIIILLINNKYNQSHISHITGQINAFKMLQKSPTAQTQSRGPIQGLQVVEVKLADS